MTIQQAITHLEFLKVAGLLDANPNQIDNDALDMAIKALKEREDLIERAYGHIVGQGTKGVIRPDWGIDNGDKTAYARPKGKWIPVSTRDMTEEEVKELEASGLLDDFDIKDFYDNPTSYWQYNCRLPDDGQKVLVSTKWGVTLTTFYSDVDYGNYFEEYEDRYDVDAWMPLPEAYKKGEENND